MRFQASVSSSLSSLVFTPCISFQFYFFPSLLLPSSLTAFPFLSIALLATFSIIVATRPRFSLTSFVTIVMVIRFKLLHDDCGVAHCLRRAGSCGVVRLRGLVDAISSLSFRCIHRRFSRSFLFS